MFFECCTLTEKYAQFFVKLIGIKGCCDLTRKFSNFSRKMKCFYRCCDLTRKSYNILNRLKYIQKWTIPFSFGDEPNEPWKAKCKIFLKKFLSQSMLIQFFTKPWTSSYLFIKYWKHSNWSAKMHMMTGAYKTLSFSRFLSSKFDAIILVICKYPIEATWIWLNKSSSQTNAIKYSMQDTWLFLTACPKGVLPFIRGFLSSKFL